MPEHISTIPVILIRLPNWIGDVCMVLPSLKLLSQTGAPILICGKPFAKPLVQEFTHFGFVPLTGKAWPDSHRLRQAIKALRLNQTITTKQPLLGLIYPDSFTSALTFWLAGVPSVGYRDDGRTLLLRWPVHKQSRPQHAVLKWYQLTCHAIKTWSLPIDGPMAAKPAIYQLTANQSDIQLVHQTLQTYHLKAQNFVLLAPTATGLHKGQVKIWSGFGELARRLKQDGITVVTCPPAHERSQAQLAAPDALMLDPMPLGAFIYLSSLAQLVVCNDSGVSHLAAIAGANQLTLFGVTDPSHTGPWSVRAQKLGTQGQWPDLDCVFERCISMLVLPDATHSERH